MFQPPCVPYLVSLGLAWSASIQLVNMLFTPEFDEAVQPAILGIAGTILFLASDMRKDNYKQAVAVLLLVVTMTVLFVLKRSFVDPKKD
jgi:hypothetical protein